MDALEVNLRLSFDLVLTRGFNGLNGSSSYGSSSYRTRFAILLSLDLLTGHSYFDLVLLDFFFCHYYA